MTFYLLNEISAVIGVFFMTLSLRGFMPHLWRRMRSGQWFNPDAIMAMILILADVKGIARMAYWDLIRPIVLGTYFTNTGGAFGTVFNASVNLIAAVIGFLGLIVLYHSIPAHDRKGWNLFTAPFYPKPCVLWRWRGRNMGDDQ